MINDISSLLEDLFSLTRGITDFTAPGQAHIQSFNHRKLSSISGGTLVNCQHFSLDMRLDYIECRGGT